MNHYETLNMYYDQQQTIKPMLVGGWKTRFSGNKITLSCGGKFLQPKLSG